MSNYAISIIAPLYNESEGFELLVNRLDAIVTNFHLPIEIVLVDDGSKDDTATKMRVHALQHSYYNCVFLSRNFGHQTAVTAGIKMATATNALFIIDGDLQDPPELLTEFYKLYEQGYDVVYAVRRKRKEGFLKRTAYKTFYRFLNKISNIDIPLDSGDFALISKRIANIYNQMPEESRYLRGMRSWIGFNQIGYEYERAERAGGEPKYTFKKLWQLAKNGIFNFSEMPIILMRRLGYSAIGLSFLYILYILYKKLVYGTVPEGFTTLVFALILFSGLQFLFLGLMGEYIIRIFFQVKNRPIFLVKEQIKNSQIIKPNYSEEDNL